MPQKRFAYELWDVFAPKPPHGDPLAVLPDPGDSAAADPVGR